MREYRDQRLQSVAPATIAKELNIISQIFDLAVTLEYLPYKHIDMKRLLPKSLTTGGPRDILTVDELVSLYQSFHHGQAHAPNPMTRGESEQIERMITFALHTGLRTGELYRIRWQDLQGDILMVREDKMRKVKEDPRRQMPLNSTLRKLLRSCLEHGASLFMHNHYGKWVRYGRSGIRRAMNRYYERGGLGKKQTDGLKIFRRTFASALQACRVEEIVIDSLLGHKMASTTARRHYTVVALDRKRDAVARLDGFYKKLPTYSQRAKIKHRLSLV